MGLFGVYRSVEKICWFITTPKQPAVASAGGGQAAAIVGPDSAAATLSNIPDTRNRAASEIAKTANKGRPCGSFRDMNFVGVRLDLSLLRIMSNPDTCHRPFHQKMKERSPKIDEDYF